ncbi:response regulator (plasmid) [Rhodobacteraceae bacterium SC52]|nr:response regulator [Rhodobacteraceae bacterium SC52]
MTTDATSFADQVGQNLPFLRRYARALTGSQASGDTYAAATLEAILNDATVLDGATDTRTALFRAFHKIWESSGAQVDSDETGLLGAVQDRMENLTRGAREALLLNTIEELPVSSIAQIMDVSQDEAQHLITVARQEMAQDAPGRVMIIEDEAIIAMDLDGIVRAIGHEVTGIARTAKAAVELGRKTKPDLVLADIHLADDSSGIDAVNTLLEDFTNLPVIFITAYPERLLTGERPEPAFLISKPYTEAQVRSAVSQALFFSSTATLTA